MTFTPENWNIPQEIRLKGCTSAHTSLTFRAKVNAQGGFKGTEQDELGVLINQSRNCSLEAKGSLVNLKLEPSLSNSFSESGLIEFQSPFFMILRAFLQPFFLALGMANALHNIISPQEQKQEVSPQILRAYNTKNIFSQNTFIDADPLTTVSMPILDKEASANNGIIENLLLGTDPVTFY